MRFEDYLEFLGTGEAGNEYPRIVVNGPAKIESKIDYVELRPDGDYFRIANRNFPLRSLASGALTGESNFAYNLARIPEQTKKARFSVFVDDGNGVRDIFINPEHILDIGRLEERLARSYSGIRRDIGRSVN